MFDIRRDLEVMMRDWDRAETATGPFQCRYVEEYVDDLDSQTVLRSISLPRHIAAHFQVGVSTVIIEVVTVDQRRLGPFTVETFEPDESGIITMRLRDGVTDDG